MGKTYNGLARLWRPGGETLEVIAGVLSELLAGGGHVHAAAIVLAGTGALAQERTASSDGLTAHHFTTGGKLIR